MCSLTMKHTRVVSTKCTPGFACRAFSDTTLVCFIVNEHTDKCSHYKKMHIHTVRSRHIAVIFHRITHGTIVSYNRDISRVYRITFPGQNFTHITYYLCPKSANGLFEYNRFISSLNILMSAARDSGCLSSRRVSLRGRRTPITEKGK